MKTYELMAIISSELSEKDAKSAAENIFKATLKKAGATISFDDWWGERGFAYTIKKQKWGYYLVLQFTIESDALTPLRNDWLLEKSVLRFMITTVDKNAPSPRPYKELKAEWEAQEKAQEKAKAPSAPSTKYSTDKLTTISASENSQADDTEKTTPATTNEKKSAEKTNKTSADEVDKKLDAIMEDSSTNL